MFTHVGEVGFHIDCKTMHSATTAEAHTNGTDFSWRICCNAHPHTGVTSKPTNVAET